MHHCNKYDSLWEYDPVQTAIHEEKYFQKLKYFFIATERISICVHEVVFLAG